MIRYIHFILSLVAGILVGIVSIQMNNDINTFFIKVFTALITFYLIGLGIRKALLNIINAANNKIGHDNITEDIPDDNIKN